MDAVGAMKIWDDLNIAPDFANVYNGSAMFDKYNGMILFEHFWTRAEIQAEDRAKELGLVYADFPEWKKFILADIVYNTGNIRNWTKVFTETEPDKVLFEARRKQEEIDGRVAKIGHYFYLINTLKDAHKIGLVGAKYLT